MFWIGNIIINHVFFNFVLTLRPASSMLTFPLQYNFPPLSMRITSRIIQKKSAYAEKIVRKKVQLQATFFVRLVFSLINLWFLTNRIEETN